MTGSKWLFCGAYLDHPHRPVYSDEKHTRQTGNLSCWVAVYLRRKRARYDWQHRISHGCFYRPPDQAIHGVVRIAPNQIKPLMQNLLNLLPKLVQSFMLRNQCKHCYGA